MKCSTLRMAFAAFGRSAPVASLRDALASSNEATRSAALLAAAGSPDGVGLEDAAVAAIDRALGDASDREAHAAFTLIAQAAWVRARRRAAWLAPVTAEAIAREHVDDVQDIARWYALAEAAWALEIFANEGLCGDDARALRDAHHRNIGSSPLRLVADADMANSVAADRGDPLAPDRADPPARLQREIALFSAGMALARRQRMRTRLAFVSSLLFACSSAPAVDAHDAATLDVAVGDASASDVAPSDDASGDAATSGLPLGTVTVVDASLVCPGGAGPGATCQSIKVSCPNVDDIYATVSVIVPSGAPTATVVGHAGGGGGGFFSAGPEGKGFAQSFASAGIRYVQIAWGSTTAPASGVAPINGDWASGGPGIKATACRPATAFHWMFDQIHAGDRTKGFCGIGTSGGSAALTYSIVHYGLKAYWDYLALGAGPAPARIDYGCDPSAYSGGTRNLCPELTNAPFAYSQGVASIADGWEPATTDAGKTCGKPKPPASDVAKWTSDSVVSTGGDYDFPQTGVSYWFCTTQPNETTGQGSFLIDALHPKDDPLDVHCYGTPDGGSPCTAEYVFADPNAQALAVSEIVAGCKPNHP